MRTCPLARSGRWKANEPNATLPPELLPTQVRHRPDSQVIHQPATQHRAAPMAVHSTTIAATRQSARLSSLRRSHKSQAKLAVSAKTNKPQGGIVGFFVDQDQIRPDVTISKARPIARQR
jgi:hypothetical protein